MRVVASKLCAAGNKFKVSLSNRQREEGGGRRVSSSKSPFGIIDDLANLINLITAGSSSRGVAKLKGDPRNAD